MVYCRASGSFMVKSYEQKFNLVIPHYFGTGLQVNSSTYSSRSNYVRVNAKRTYILLVHGALRWYIVLTYLPCVARWPAPPGVLTCSKNVARRVLVLPIEIRAAPPRVLVYRQQTPRGGVACTCMPASSTEDAKFCFLTDIAEVQVHAGWS